MGNTCIQRDKLSNIDSLQVSIEIKNNQPISLDNSLTFKEILRQNGSRYVFQEGDFVQLPLPLSPKVQHQIQYLEPKYINEETIFSNSEQKAGILSHRSTQQEPSSDSTTPNLQDKVKRKVNFQI